MRDRRLAGVRPETVIGNMYRVAQQRTVTGCAAFVEIEGNGRGALSVLRVGLSVEEDRRRPADVQAAAAELRHGQPHRVASRLADAEETPKSLDEEVRRRRAVQIVAEDAVPAAGTAIGLEHDLVRGIG